MNSTLNSIASLRVCCTNNKGMPKAAGCSFPTCFFQNVSDADHSKRNGTEIKTTFEKGIGIII